MKQKKLEKLERYVVRLMLTDDGAKDVSVPTRIALWHLKQLSRVYYSVVQLRLFLFRKGMFRHHTLGCQVISVGNLTVGGTGKTPVVEVFARELQKAGRKVAILSRGYKKKEPSFFSKLADKFLFREARRKPRVVSDGSNLLLNSEMSGDEPYMLASNLPDVAVLVDKNRVKSGRYAINKLGCDTLVLDDGFQYMGLKHSMEIVLVDTTNPFGNEMVIPRGMLREPVKNIKRADFIFLTKSRGKKNTELKARMHELNSKAEIIECHHCSRYLQNVFSNERKELDHLKDLDIAIVSGIADPRGFEGELARRGANVTRTFRFADHHRYSQQEIIDIINKSIKLKSKAIITTEKDAVRFPMLDRRDIPIYFLRVDIEMHSGVEDFHACISRICFR